MRKSYVFVAGLAGILAAVVPAAAQSWPDKPVRIVVPYGPGGPTDVIARILADKLGVRSKQSIVIENRPGAGSNIGTAAVARAAPDGAMLLVNTSAVAVNQTLFKSPGYDAVKELTAVINVGQSPNVIIASKSLKAMRRGPASSTMARRAPGPRPTSPWSTCSRCWRRSMSAMSRSRAATR